MIRNPGRPSRQTRTPSVSIARRTIQSLLLAGLVSCDRCDTTEPDELEVDLEVTVADTPDPVVAGGLITYTVVITNHGPDEATTVVMEAAANGVQLQSAQPGVLTSGTCFPPTATTGQCRAARLVAGASAEFVVTALAPNAAGQVSTRVSVSSDQEADDDDNNNVAIATTTVVAQFTITTQTTPNTGAGLPYDTDIAVGGGTGQVVYSLESGQLPPGVSLNTTTGKLSGAATSGGIYSFQIRAVNAGPPLQVAVKSYQITVIEIETAQLPDGVVGQSYLTTIFTRADLPATWTYTVDPNQENGLPPGIAFPNGTGPAGLVGLTGTPTQAGTFTFTAHAAGATGGQHSKRLSITIHAPGTPPTAAFTYQCNGLTCDFNGTGSTAAPGNTIAAYGWTFGDNATASGASVQHTYPNAGTFPVTLTVTDNHGATDAATQNVVLTTSSTTGGEFVALNFSRGPIEYTENQSGGLTLKAEYPSLHTGVSEGKALNQPGGGSISGPARVSTSQSAAVSPTTTAVFFSYITTKDVVRWNVGAGGGLTEAQSFVFPEAPFQFDVNPEGTCVAVPLQSGARIQMLTAALSPTSQLVIAGSFPTKVLFNPAHAIAYAVDGTRVLALATNPTTCALAETGTAPTYTNRRDVAVDPRGEFLHVLTFTPVGATSSFLLQRLTNGMPAGTPAPTPLPAAAFLIEPHPTLDVVYVLQDAPSTGIRKLTFDRVGGTVTIGAFVAAPGVDEVAFNGDASRLYYTNVASATHARICWFDLSPQGDLLGSPTCDDNPLRNIDSDLIFISPPPPAAPRRSSGTTAKSLILRRP